jgi:hypothetical protein
MEEQVQNKTVVYSCVYRKEDKNRFRQRRNRDMFKNGSINDKLFDQPIDSKQLLGEICNVSLYDVFFTTYLKNDGFLDMDYKIQLLIDTEFFNIVETDIQSQIQNNESQSASEEDDHDHDHAHDFNHQYANQLDEFKELLSPFKTFFQEDENNNNNNNNVENDSNILSSLRSQCLLIPIKLTNHWTLIWIKFTKFKKLIEMYQISGSINHHDKLSYKSQQIIKLFISDILNINKENDLIYSYKYISRYLHGLQEDRIIIDSIQKILKGYQYYGFNITPDNLPYLDVNETEVTTRVTRTRALPLSDLDDIREYNEKILKSRPKIINTVPVTMKSNEVRKRNAETNIKCNNTTVSNGNNTKNENKRVRSVENSDDLTSKPKSSNENKRIKSVENADELASKLKSKNENKKIKSLENPSKLTSKLKSKPTLPEPTTNKINSRKIIVTLDNLASIKQTIDYDPKKMSELVDLYIDTYNKVEALLLDKWSRINSFSKIDSETFEPPFLIYGPSQIELEILREDEIIATNTLKEKIKKYNVSLNTKTMRYLTSSRRWINQRFKLNKKLKNVYYTRDVDLIVPDYQDIPYIVLATHLAYNCLTGTETFDIIHQNWYISRKMVSFIISQCCKCHGKRSKTTR